MKIAIPTYRRYQQLGEKTLNFLQTMKGFTHSDITIFVADDYEFLRYVSLYPEYHIVIGEKGIKNARNFIMKYYDKNEYVVSLDDDIECLESMGEDYSDLFVRGERELRKTGLTLWGVNPVKNTFFMQKQKYTTTSLKFCIGQMFGFINKKYKLTVEVKEDYQFCILNYMNYGGVLRFNQVAVKSKMYASGGVGSKKDRWEVNETATAYLRDKYPEYCVIVRGGDQFAELRLSHFHRFSEGHYLA